jgi:secreted PhoX family phosphatase
VTTSETSSDLSRRSFLGRTAATGLGVALVGSVDTLFGAGPASAAEAVTAGYGPLVPDPRGILALPRGFSYTIVAETGVTRLVGGAPTPSDPDGTAAFPRPGGNGSVLVNNHEISDDEEFPVPHRPGFVYDDQARGGTTNIVVDANGRRVSEYVSLAGTHNNCAGGRTPWGTWLTCEETEDVLGKPHGYVFEVDPNDQEANRNPVPIKALGRFAHEAVAIDPDEGRAYLTEDASNPNGLLYRFTPPAAALPLGKGSLRNLGPNAGRLDALKAFDGRGRFVPDLSVATRPGTTYSVEWTGVRDRDASTIPTRLQFPDGQVTRSRKLEGMWWANGGAYFVSSFARTEDGSAGQHDGQVWFLDPVADTIRLTLRFAYTPTDQDTDADGPDNITVSPYGGVIVAEDGEGVQHLLGSNARGQTFFFARNELNDSEFTGPNFSADKKTMFANIQSPGHVLAIRGPFARQP